MPRPWLARLATAVAALAVLAAGCGVGTTLLSADAAGNGFVRRQLDRWQAATTSGEAVEVLRIQADAGCAAVIGPLSWLLAAGLLRAAATGRLRLTGRLPPSARWLAVGVLGLGLLGVASGVWRWHDPMGSAWWQDEPHQAVPRFRRVATGGWTHVFYLEQPPGFFGGSVQGASSAGKDPARQLGLAVCHEGTMLFGCVRGGGLLMVLAATVLVAGRPAREE